MHCLKASALLAAAPAIVLAFFIPAATAAGPMTLEEALALAERRNPALIAARAQVASARGELEDVRAPLWNNPEIATESRRRSLGQNTAPDVSRYDTGIGLSQRFELGGQQQARRGAAEAGQRAVQQSIEDIRREVRGEAAQRFFQVMGLQQRVQMEEQALDLLRRAAELTGKRVKAGEDSRLDGNLAAIEAERGANQAAQADERLSQARAALSAHLQLDPGFQPEAVGELDAAAPSYTLNDLLVAAARRPKLQLLAAREEAARRRLDLERGNTYPDLTVGLSYSPERNIDTTDRITTLSFALPLPIFRRNAGGIGRAQTELDQARTERQAAERDTQAAVNALWLRLQSLQQRVDRLQQTVLSRLEENQQLAFKALQAGEIGLSQFLLVRRQVLDGRRDLLEARTELRAVRIAVEAAAGWPSELPPLEPSAREDRQ
jgi:cobalt-zinc-cadmium efflux system outer membrane protein